ncbi:MAG: DUF504 domain-containing protein [Archaeoglobaceae archaeon]|nr:DUF504 domain-containing protein [Archaeoglobaceae archaeon]MCX8152424.1 DUF504 domain-containing protein [Archaeoglobaceae archaeon]MDW8013764.1 DUF504 domain-containing protein [Archaeoglobaceae archaeon]
MKKSKIQELLNKYRWHPALNPSLLTVVYVDRFKGFSSFKGDEIEGVGRKFVYLKSGILIPVHRIVEIRYRDDVVWRKF